MKNYKSKFDFNRPFKLIHSRSQFDQIKPTDYLFYTHEREQPIGKNKNKQEIHLPNIEIIQSLTKPKHFAKITPNYIRISSALNLPKENQYELTQIDYCYLKSHHANIFQIGNQNILNQQFFKNCIMELQKKASQLTKFPLTSKWLIDFIHKEYKQLLSMYNLEALVNSLYNYWRNRREQLKFPLYRLFWRDEPYHADNLKPFKRRIVPRRNLRKFAQIDEEQIIEQLISEFNNTLLICDRIQARQDLKSKNIQLQILSFHKECEQYFKASQEWKQQCLDQINRQKDKQKIKSMKQQLQQFKHARYSSRNNSEPNTITKSVMALDKNLTLVNFLASVINQAEQKGICFQTIYQNGQKAQQIMLTNGLKNDYINNTLDLNKKQTVEQDYPIIQKHNEDNEDNIQLSIQKCRNLILRSFEIQPQETIRKDIVETILDYRRKRLAQYYFGDDDDIGQYKDLRKNINNSFKRFLQINNTNLQFISNK